MTATVSCPGSHGMIPSVWTAIRRDLPLADAICFLKDFGWRAFEISSEHLSDIETAPDPSVIIEQTLAKISSTGVAVPQAHALLRANVAHSDPEQRRQDMRRLLDHIAIAGRLGVRCVVIHAGYRRDPDAAGAKIVHRLNVDAFRRLGDAAAERGMCIGVENPLSPQRPAPACLLEFLQDIGHSGIGITLDTSHAHMAGINVAAAVLEFGPRLVATHISDNHGTKDEHLTPGNGTIDWPAAMQALGAIGYKGLCNLEIPGERHGVGELQRLKLRHAHAVSCWLVKLAEPRPPVAPPGDGTDSRTGQK